MSGATLDFNVFSAIYFAAFVWMLLRLSKGYQLVDMAGARRSADPQIRNLRLGCCSCHAPIELDLNLFSLPPFLAFLLHVAVFVEGWEGILLHSMMSDRLVWLDRISRMAIPCCQL